MIYIGDYFSIILLSILAMFFFEAKHKPNRASRLFLACLFFTALNALVDIWSCRLLNIYSQHWVNMTANTLYYIVNIMATTSVSIYLFNKILEHSHSKKCMKYALIGTSVIWVVYLFFVITNIWNGWIFYFEGQKYCHGPFHSIGYVIAIVQMGLVSMCYIRNRKNASKSMRRLLVQIFPLSIALIFIQLSFPEIMLNSFIMTMVLSVIFLTFNGQRPGVHALTRLNDRHRFFEDLTARMKSGESFQIFVINLRNFGAINIKYGHMFGDEVLYQFAFSLEKLIKDSDAYHMSGTVFAVVLPCANQQLAEKNRTAIINYVDNGVVCKDEAISGDYVIVEYISDNNYNDAEQLYELLEYASNKARISKLSYLACTAELAEEMQRRRYLFELLQHIDREHGFSVWYQPIKHFPSNEYASMEALMRIVEPDGTVISPAEFIPIAENIGVVSTFTWFVLEETCRMLRDNPVLEGVRVGVNMPISQMLDNGFVARVNSVVDKYGVDHERIVFEFTEREILENFASAKRTMERMNEAGYSFYLDDFGAGYSNFVCLLQLPFQSIKLDMQLVRMDIDKNGKERTGLVRTLTGFLQKLGLSVVAEGVENEAVAETMRSIGVDKVQGYVYAKPMPEEKVLGFYEGLKKQL